MISYAGLAKNGYVIADYSTSEDDFRVEFQKILTSSGKSDSPTQIVRQDQRVFYLRHHPDGYVFVCMASALCDEKAPNEFLDALQKQAQVYLGKGENEDSGAKSAATDLTKIMRGLLVSD